MILDNLSSHKGPRVAPLLHAVGADVLYRPRSSPDLNPIENAFGKIKRALRGAEQRSLPDLWSAIQPVLDRITADDAAAYFRHCGYATRIN